MIDYKDRRDTNTSYIKDMKFVNITLHGIADIDKIPDEIVVYIVPELLERLQNAYNGIQQGAELSGCKLRAYDVVSSNVTQKLKDAKIILHKWGDDHVTCELTCHCSNSISCFISELTLHKSFFMNEK